jgi:hypothetical protein
MIGFIGTSLQLQSMITAHGQLLPKTHSISYCTTSVSSSTVTKANEESLPNEFSWTELTSMRTEHRSPSRTVRLLFCVISFSGK